MARHRSKYTQYKKGANYSYTSFILFDKYGIENCKIELVELYPCDSKEELNRREGHWIKNEECVNKSVAGRTRKEYYRDNIEYEIARKKTPQARQQQQEYRERNREKIREFDRAFYQNHKEQLKEKRVVKINCAVCGSCFQKTNKSNHEKSQRHLSALENNK